MKQIGSVIHADKTRQMEISMKRITVLPILICMFSCSMAAPSDRYAIIRDPDGSVNIRGEENLSRYSIEGRLPNGEPVSCINDFSYNPKFCFILSENKEGFIYRNRLLFLNKSKEFKKLNITNESNTSAILKNNHAELLIKIKNKIINKNDYSITKDKFGNDIYKLKGKTFFGTDGTPVYSTYLFSKISLKIGNKELLVPQSDLEQVFIPSYFVSSRKVFSNIHAYINPKDKHVYMFSSFADGAAIYTIVFEFKNNQYYRKYIWSEAL